MAYGVPARDDKGRIHLLEITLPMGYPASPPTITAVSLQLCISVN